MELKGNKMNTDLMEVLLGDTAGEATMQLADPSLLQYYQRISEREYLLDYEISSCINEIIQWIRYWNREDAKKRVSVENRRPITLLLDTPGGDAMEGLTLYSTMKASKTPIRVVVLGECASAGMLVLAGATPGQRFAMAGSSLLIHEGYTAVSNSSGKTKDTVEYYNKLDKQYKDSLIANSKITPELFEKNERIEWWLNAQEALELGLVDHIVADLDEIAGIDDE